MRPRCWPFSRISLLALALGLLALAVALPFRADSSRAGIPTAPAHLGGGFTPPTPPVGPIGPPLRPAQTNLLSPTLSEARWTPSAIFNDGSDSTLFTISATDGIFDSAYITTEGLLQGDSDLSSNLQQVAADLQTGLIRVYDDGTHGDRAAGDEIFSRAGITATGALIHDGGSHDLYRLRFVAFDEAPGGFYGGGSYYYEWIQPGDLGLLGVVNAALRGAVPTLTLDTNLTATSHALFYVDDGTLFPNYFHANIDAAVEVCQACEILINRFGDVFDFITLYSLDFISETPACDCVAFETSPRNDVGGIGLPLFNNNGGPGFTPDGLLINTFSPDRLQGIIFNKLINGWALTHEVLHQWAAFVAPAFGWLDGAGHFTAFNDVNGLNHYSLSDTTGVLRPESPNQTDLFYNEDGTFRVVARALPGEYPTYHPLELYLMGLVPPSQVPPMHIAGEPIDFSNLDGVVAGGGVTTLTIDDIIAIEGPRIPSVDLSQKAFTMGTLVFSDRPYTEAEMTFITLALRYFESDKVYDGNGAPPFASATGGRASFQVALPGLDLGFEVPPTPTPAAAALTADVGGPLLLGESTTVTVTVRDAGSAPVANAPVRWSEGLVSAALSADTGATDRSGQASVLFTASEPGTYEITATVLEAVEGQLVESSVAGSVTVDVVSPLPPPPPPPQTRRVTLVPGWNLVSWSGEALPVTAAIAPTGGILDAVFTWDAAGQRFFSYNPALPVALNTLTTLEPGAGLWVYVDARTGGVWEQPAFAGAQSAPLRLGFNLVAWSGPDATPIEEAVAGLGGALEVLFVWDAQAQRYLSYTPGAPAFLNTAEDLRHGEGVWIKVNRSVTWEQSAPETLGLSLLQPGTDVDLFLLTGERVEYEVLVPAGASRLVVEITAGGGDADLYVKFGGRIGDEDLFREHNGPDLFAPYLDSVNEVVELAQPRPGVYAVTVYGFSEQSAVTLSVSIE